MTAVATVAAHEIVRRTYPRPAVTEQDELAMAVGKAIDGALSRFSHEAQVGRRPTHASMLRYGLELLDTELAEIDLTIGTEERARISSQLEGSLRAFRKGPAYGWPRPRSRLVVLDDRAGYYAQPDFWNGRDRFFEMKSYRPQPVPPDLLLQVHLFQLAFPECRSALLCVDRHATPVATTVLEVPPADPARRDEVLRTALAVALELGVPKLLEFADPRTVRYAVSPPEDHAP